MPTSPRLDPEALQAFLVIGSDYRPQLGTAGPTSSSSSCSPPTAPTR